MEPRLPRIERETYNIPHRIRKIQTMRRGLGLEPLPRQYFESNELPRVSIGIEIEMQWRHVMPELALEWPKNERPRDHDPESERYQSFVKAYDAYDTALKPVLESIVRPTIPKVGADAYWEFSFLPTRNLTITDAELSSLYESGILSDGVDYSLHMTISDIPSHRDAFALLTLLELNGGTTRERIMQPANSNRSVWAIKGEGGILKRTPSELVGASEGYELRTLSARSLKATSELLHTAQALTEMMISEDNSMFATWICIRNDIEAFLKDNGLPLEVWQSPRIDSETWQTYANLIGQYKPN